MLTQVAITEKLHCCVTTAFYSITSLPAALHFGGLFYWRFAALLTKLHEWQGRLIAYLGGGSVSAYSYDAAAKAGDLNQLITTSAFPYDYRLISMIISICGLLVVVVRLGWDIWTYFDKRKQGRADE